MGVFLCNKTRYAYTAEGVTVRAQSTVPVDMPTKTKLEMNFLISELIKKGDLYWSDKVPDSFKTTQQQLSEAQAKIAQLEAQSKGSGVSEKEVEELKAEALSEIAKRDAEIEELKKQLAAAKTVEIATDEE